MDVERGDVYLERNKLGFVGPDERRGQVWIVGVAGDLLLAGFVEGREPGRWVVRASRLSVTEILYTLLAVVFSFSVALSAAPYLGVSFRALKFGTASACPPGPH